MRNVKPLSGKKFQSIGESLDKLISLDVNGREVINSLYTNARALTGQPLTTTAAVALNQVAQRGKAVILITGFPSLSWIFEDLTETDGPVGTAILARMLEEAYGMIPIIVTSRYLVKYVNASLIAAGLIPTDLDTALTTKPELASAPAAGVVAFTTDLSSAQKEATSLLSKTNPAAVIAIEMPGPAYDGKCHTFKGRVIPDHLIARGDVIFNTAQNNKIITIGFGDGGNELGMGRLAGVVSRIVPNGEQIACIVPADIAVASSISNWGACGVAAALGALVNKNEILQNIDVDRIIRGCVNAGVLDGISDRPEYKEDKTPVELSKAIMTLMQFTVQQALSSWYNG